MATHSSILAWKILWMEKPGRLQSMGSQRVGHNRATSLSLKKKKSVIEGRLLCRRKLNLLVQLEGTQDARLNLDPPFAMTSDLPSPPSSKARHC